MTLRFRGCSLATLVVAALAIAAPAAHADIDATGTWLITVFTSQFTEQWVQSGPVLVIDGNTGTIDPHGGTFSVTFAPDPMDPCSGGSLSGTVAADGQTFSGNIGVCGDTPTLCCALGGGQSFPATGMRLPDNCGNGVIDLGEECDDGNNAAGDGCDPSCHVEACYACSGAPSACSPLPNGSACDDGNVCTANACNGSGTCVVTGPAMNCNDGHACTIDSCDPELGCVHTPDVRSCRSAAVAKLLVKTNTDPSKDKLAWKWLKGESTSQSDFGLPTGTTAYRLCVFAGPTNTLVGEADIGPDAQKWRARGTSGFQYKDPSGAADGISKIVLAGSASNRAKIVLHGAGAGLSFSAPPYALPVTAQLSNSSTSACWSASYATARDGTGLFKATTKSP